MTKSTDLTKGPITERLIRLAIPLIATNFIQTAYSFVDMIWIGKLGNSAVIAIGTASFSINMAFALFTVIATGTGIRISNSFGSKEYKDLEKYIVNGFILAFILALIYSAVVIIFRHDIIGFFNIEEEHIRIMASKYLLISVLGTIFMFFNSIFSSVLTSLGNSKLSFKINSVGFALNMILDPILIFGIGNFLQMGVLGAAVATIISRLAVFAISIIKGLKLLEKKKFNLSFDLNFARDVLALGSPFAVQRISFTLIGIVIARIISMWGAEGIAVQKIGLQIEAISYMTMGGLYGAVSAFIGQNYGAGNIARINRAYDVSVMLSLAFGIFTSLLLLLIPKQIFGIFLDDPDMVAQGVEYLRIIGLSQAFMCVEIVTMASFNGLGKTRIPAIVSLTFTGLRIPIALILSERLGWGVTGVWWTISLTSMIKGTVLASWFKLHMNNKLSLPTNKEALNV